ncbi:hypothetical protein W03_22820 [Nitrosomonas sp. PY1]|uniref:sulfotransferase family protein n=1 Tax=Nitrosomonas sp. PY1 TaxID=1803906 RepID=UPI001FC86333|nr:sulfotransferase domain-containing protein [Nitrosomonas sp. PY1]GKS70278.1 hypothetical protein W03_22820 [Nitrosomonas sp. PY1]
MTLANFIIAGTEKAGTTSVFTYLSTHPLVCGSAVKETDFFRNGYFGDRNTDMLNYSKYFASHCERKTIVMEASPGYLGSGAEVAPRIHALIPKTKLLFILRDPVDRMYSSFNFHIGKLNICKDMSFSEYIDQCIAYDSKQKSPAELGMDEWYLKVISYGRYAEYLKYYYQCFPTKQIKIMFFEDMNRDILSFMQELCQFLEIPSDYFANYDFKKINVTYESRLKWLHKIAVWLNAKSERLLRQRPQLKQSLVDLYKKTNQAREGYDQIPEQDYLRLRRYYAPSVDSLRTLIENRTIPWNM